MAYIDPPWDAGLATHRYINKEHLIALLTDLPHGAVIVVNPVGNFAVMADDTMETQLGYIDIGHETYETM